jgi:Ca2+-binding EF-hand superfamily protein
VSESGLNPYFNVFDQVDSNHDGKISRQEFQEHMHPAKAGKVVGQLLKEVFDGIDANKDGSLSRKELEDAYAKLLNTTEEKSGKNWQNLMLDAGLNTDFYVFEQFDTNQDGKVTWEEFSKTLQPAPNIELFLKRTFDRLDANGDGIISKEELTDAFTRVLDIASPLAGNKTFRMLLKDAGINPDSLNFEKLDTNQDGIITREEFEAKLAEVLKKSTPYDASPDLATTEKPNAADASPKLVVTEDTKNADALELVETEKTSKSVCCC